MLDREKSPGLSLPRRLRGTGVGTGSCALFDDAAGPSSTTMTGRLERGEKEIGVLNRFRAFAAGASGRRRRLGGRAVQERLVIGVGGSGVLCWLSRMQGARCRHGESAFTDARVSESTRPVCCLPDESFVQWMSPSRCPAQPSRITTSQCEHGQSAAQSPRLATTAPYRCTQLPSNSFSLEECLWVLKEIFTARHRLTREQRTHIPEK